MSLSSKMFTLLILLPITFSPIILNLNNSLLFAKNWLSSESRDNVTLDGNRREAKVAKTLCGLLLFFKWKIPVESKFVTLTLLVVYNPRAIYNLGDNQNKILSRNKHFNLMGGGGYRRVRLLGRSGFKPCLGLAYFLFQLKVCMLFAG